MAASSGNLAALLHDCAHHSPNRWRGTAVAARTESLLSVHERATEFGEPRRYIARSVFRDLERDVQDASGERTSRWLASLSTAREIRNLKAMCDGVHDPGPRRSQRGFRRARIQPITGVPVRRGPTGRDSSARYSLNAKGIVVCEPPSGRLPSGWVVRQRWRSIRIRISHRYQTTHLTMYEQVLLAVWPSSQVQTAYWPENTEESRRGADRPRHAGTR